jgi:ribosome-associated protein
LHLAEQWRDRLIADEEAMHEWMQRHPDTDTQQLRALIRQARKDTQPDNTSISQGLAPAPWAGLPGNFSIDSGA